MALITSAASGNFSAGATWTGGVVPGVGDEARASTGHTITIDVNTTCDLVSNVGTGNFILADGITLTANVTKGNTATACISLTGTDSANIVGDVTGFTSGPGTTHWVVRNLSSGTLAITGNITGGSAGSSGPQAVSNNAGTLNVTGNVSAGTGGNSNSVFSHGITNGVGTVNVTGNVSGGTSGFTGNKGIDSTSAGTISVIGTVTAGTLTNAHAIRSTSTSATVKVVGDIIASNVIAGVSAGNSGTHEFSGSFIFSENGTAPIDCLRYKLNTTPSAAKTRYALDGTGNYVDMFTADNSLTQADPTDVRSGTVYADGNLTGTLAVPAAGSVALGVPVDNTTGTAALTPASVWDHLLSAITTSDSIGTLLKTNIDATISSRSTATTAGIADAVWDEVLNGSEHNIASSAGKRLRILDEERIIAEGQVQSATTSTVTLEPIGTLCVGQTIIVTDQSTGDKQTRYILEFDGDTDTATVDTQWCVVPTAGDEYLLTTVRDPLVTRNDHPTGTVGAEIDEQYLLQGLKTGSTLTVTPTSRTAGGVSQTIGGDGTTTTTVSRD